MTSNISALYCLLLNSFIPCTFNLLSLVPGFHRVHTKHVIEPKILLVAHIYGMTDRRCRWTVQMKLDIDWMDWCGGFCAFFLPTRGWVVHVSTAVGLPVHSCV